MISVLSLAILVTSCVAAEIQPQIHVISIPKAEQKYEIVQGNEEMISVYQKGTTTIGIKLDPEDQICKAVQHKIAFSRYFGQQKEILPRKVIDRKFDANDFQPHANDPSYFLTNPILVNMAHIKNGFAAVTSDHQMMIINITETKASSSGFVVEHTAMFDYSLLRPLAYEHVTPQIVYEPINENIFIVYPAQIIVGQLSELVSLTPNLRNLTNIQGGFQNDRNYVGNVRVSNGHLFVPIGNDGLDIYKAEPNGDLTFKKSIDALDLYGIDMDIFVTDVAIGGDKGQYLYVLDKNRGITLFDIADQAGEAFRISKVHDFGMIPVLHGIIIKEYNNANIFVLCKKQRTSYVQEYAINNPNYGWFLVRTHYLKGKYFDIDVTDRIAILRGTDAHRVIYHSIYSAFQPTYQELFYDSREREEKEKLDEEYVYIPKLMSTEFFSRKFGFGDPKSWHFNQKHEFLFGMTTHGVIEIPFLSFNPGVSCYPKYRWNIGKIKRYRLTINSTDCAQKQELLQKTGDNPYLYMCRYDEELTVAITSGHGKFSSEELFSIILGLTLLLVVLAIILAHLFKRFQAKKEALTAEISGFESKGYQVDAQTPVEI